MIDTDKYEEFENAMNEGRIERVHCLWALAEVKRLRGLLNTIADKALHEVNTQPNGDDSPYNNILNIAYEGVIE